MADIQKNSPSAGKANVPAYAQGEWPECPVCFGRSQKKVRPMMEGYILFCPDCRLTYIYPPIIETTSLSSGQFSVQTDGVYTAKLMNASVTIEAKYEILAENRQRYYSQHLGRSAIKLLEIGCGAAGMEPFFHRLGVEYHGIDLDERTIKLAKSQGKKNIRQLDFFDLRETETFDVICGSQVLEHITEPRLFIAKVCRHMRPQGLLHLDVPNDRSLAGFLSRLDFRNQHRYHGIDWPFHLFSYRKPTLRILLRQSFGSCRVFTSRPDDAIFGKAVVPSFLDKLYYIASSCLNRRSILVGIAQKDQQ
jgi:SAM-dependent methyltransferase